MIEMDDVAYSYGDQDLISNVSLHIRPGSFYFLTGPSGAGKSTFLKLCYMELLASTGSVQVFGKDVRTLTRDQIAGFRRHIGIIHQDCKFLDHLSLEYNISLPLIVSGTFNDRAQQNLDELTSWVGLTGRLTALPKELSGGELQRAALARAVIMDPEIIVADEPTGNIDWQMSQKILSLLVDLNKMGKSIIVATHDMNFIRAAKSQVSARVLRIKNRRLELAGVDL